MRTGLQRELAHPSLGVLEECDDRRRVVSVRLGPLRHAERCQRQYGRARIVGQHARVASGPSRRQLRAVQQCRGDDRGADGPDEPTDVVILGKVLADERGDRDLLPDLHELHRHARNVHCLPPPDLRMQGSAQVVLEDLA